MSNVECHKLPVASTCCFDMLLVWTGLVDMSNVECYKLPVASTCCLCRSTCRSNMSNVASTCCLLPFDMLLRHVAGVGGALENTIVINTTYLLPCTVSKLWLIIYYMSNFP